LGSQRARVAEGLKAAGLLFDISPGEGAFYGPKEFHASTRPSEAGS
jgi:hypothetical protein